jgi:NADPH:quinone reductase-like Zn-dependent oxidoreductase
VNTRTGTNAEYCAAQADFVFHLPSNVSFEQGSALGVPYFTAYRALIIKYDTRFCLFIKKNHFPYKHQYF